jgi:hydroxymethylglutaryl-CoA lyase
MRVRAYLSTAFGCPYEGEVSVARVAELSAALGAMGAFEVAVSDTIGVAHPGQVLAVVDAVAGVVPLERIALHFHDTRGTALANVLAALDMGVAIFDSSAGGIGGCPYAPGAAGNLPTEDLIYMLDGLGIETGVDLARVVAASRFIESRIGRPLPSRYAQAAKTSNHASQPSSRPADRRSSS